jgi:hypothetical protein
MVVDELDQAFRRVIYRDHQLARVNLIKNQNESPIQHPCYRIVDDIGNCC